MNSSGNAMPSLIRNNESAILKMKREKDAGSYKAENKGGFVYGFIRVMCAEMLLAGHGTCGWEK